MDSTKTVTGHAIVAFTDTFYFALIFNMATSAAFRKAKPQQYQQRVNLVCT